jgi:hypothetical protein
MGLATLGVATLLVGNTAFGQEFNLQPGARITSFQHYEAALVAGKSVRVINSYVKCVQIDPETGVATPGPEAIAGTIIDTFERFAPGVYGNQVAYVATSKSQLIYVNGGFMYDYVKIRFYADGLIQIVTKFYDPKNHQVIDLHGPDFQCTLDTGDGQNGVSMFIN